MVFAMRKVVLSYLDEIETRYIGREFMVLFAMSFLYLAMLVGYTSMPGYVDAQYWWIIVPAILFALIMFLILYYLLFQEAVWRKRGMEQKKNEEIHILQYSKIMNEMESFRRIRHDMRHHLSGLSEMLAQGKTEEMKAYLDELIGYTVVRDQTFYCKNETINSLLQYYVGYALNENIRVEVQARCEKLAIPATDLTVVFGNIMENAIHSCMKAGEGPESLITVQIDTIGNSLVIEVINPCTAVHFSEKYAAKRKRLQGGTDSYCPAEAFLSDRKDGGLGLRSIARTAQIHGGTARFRFDSEKKVFISQIRMDISEV